MLFGSEFLRRGCIRHTISKFYKLRILVPFFKKSFYFLLFFVFAVLNESSW